MIQFEKPVSPSKIIETLSARIARAKKVAAAYNTVINTIFPKWEGKKFTKRVTNDAVAALAIIGIRGWYHAIAGMNYIKFEAPLGEVSFMFCYDTDMIITKEKFEHHCMSYGNNDEYISRMEQGILNSVDICVRWNTALAALQKINEEAGKYELEYELDVKNNR